MELAHLTLPSCERKNIASKIAAKVPFEAILDDVQSSVEDEIKRKHLVTKQDLRNIIREFCLDSDSVRHSDDALSVEAWVEKERRNDEKVALSSISPKEWIWQNILN
ncbi:hypothetical protein ANN_03961 [Periplaneta americana]|uniref:Uncharacterized protein n=1 Tax=Periplaneta americana TaxID=6978 RepID=A0ABQ8T790_PERAM|nr:hypothetical protein ANN_03961 [Periplaneta americana]